MFMITVHEPDPPDDIKVSSFTSVSVNITWWPSYNGGLPQHFTLQYKLSSQLDSYYKTYLENIPDPSNKEGPVLVEICLDGLQQDTSYTLRVMAVNSNIGNNQSGYAITECLTGSKLN